MKFKAKIYIEYDDVLSMCHNLEHDTSKMKPDLFVGITRGGLLPAVHLSHALSIPMIPLHWTTRDNPHKEINNDILKAIKDKKTVVFVDDINDTGKTFSEISEKYGGGLYVSLVEKCTSKFNSDATSLRFDDDRWIVFPWEKD
ncbi:MAG: hypothetical protein CBB72_016330 [Muricauda sp. TMED12]|nr:MAG: hypothetical protein CBB72_016330 [Muricauda sp. TMED12]